ncbi:hypothetical protein MLD38_027441 [Melastoma candidum]|uniref:Uncharacterized protein n=1 Tax=Melastoma candidum TaxID=119954 RepID=A0ACB9P7M1_9MYRT|nr:hypothetical protein MLD38_027441 [Melastoma candidum]
MLHYRSLPIRVARTLLLGLPLLLGISVETQKIKIEVLRHREGYPRSEAIRFGLIPRAGAESPPQVIEAEMDISSQLPWMKELLHNWRWTFYVWSSLYTYTLLLMVVLCCCRWLVLPQAAPPSAEEEEEGKRVTREEEEEGPGTEREREMEMEETMRRWEQRRRRRRKRKAILMSGSGGGAESSSALTEEDGG